MSINERIEEIINIYFSGNKSAFAKKVGVSTSVIENIVGKRKSNPSFDVAVKIYSAFDDLNPEWLFKGEGTMKYKRVVVDNNNLSSTPDTQVDFEPEFYKISRPLIRLGNEHMGKPNAFTNAIASGDCESVVIPFINDYDFSLIAHGQSMVNEESQSLSIPENSLIACKLLGNPSHIYWGELYALATTNGYVIKKIQKSSKEGFVTCASFNKLGKYKNFDLPVNEIMEWALVVGIGSFKEL